MLFRFFSSPIMPWFGSLQSSKAIALRPVGARAADPGENNLEQLSIAFCRGEKRVREKH